MPSPVGDILAALGCCFDRLGVRWYVFGAQAAIFHGVARLTADVDVTIQLGARSTNQLVAALDESGFTLRVSAADDFLARTRVLPVVHAATRMPVDVVLAGPGLEELFLDRSEMQTVDGARIPVASAEDLIAMKVLAGRPKDLDDAAGILKAQLDRLDIERVRTTLALLEGALAQSDLLPQLEKLLERARRRS